MSASRALFGGLLLTAALAAGQTPESVRFLSPGPGEVVAGTTRLRVAIEPSLGADRVDYYAAGRLLGSAKPPDWALEWEAPRDGRQLELVAIAFAGKTKVGRAALSTGSIPGFSETLEVTAVQLFPTVVDRRGRYVSGLTREAFEVREENRVIPIETFSAEVPPLVVALLLDTSESMTEEISLVQEAARQFVERLKPEDRVAIYGFSHVLRSTGGFTSDKGLAKDRIGGLAVRGGTALWDSAIRVLDEMGAGSTRRILVVFSDGRDELSLNPLDRVVIRAHETETILYAIAAGEDSKDVAAHEGLKLLAGETGGEAHLIASVKKIRQAFDAILADLNSQYVLTYTPPPGRAGLRQVEVRTKDDKLEVRCRKSYLYGVVGGPATGVRR